MIITEDKELDIFVASKIGSFKHIKYHTYSIKNSKKCIENLIDVKSLQKEDAITHMVWGNPEQTEIIIGKKNQQIQIYDTQKDLFTKTYEGDFGTGHLVGLGRYKRRLLAALSSGVVKIWSKKEDQLINTGGKLDRMRICADDTTVFATGGEENDLKIWRIGEPAPIFAAKNLAHDWLQLRRPVWVSDLTFVPGEDGRLAAACSRHGYVRLYDTRAQRRPVCNVDFTNMAATCISPSFDNRQVLVGFGRGQLHQVDLRQARPDKGYKGCAGAVTDISAVAGSLVISASLDRHLRVHRHQTKEMVYKQYLTSKLSCLLVQTETSTPLRHHPDKEEIKEEIKEESSLEPDTDNLDQIFDNMETISDKPRKTKSSRVGIEPEVKRIKPSTEGNTDAGVGEESNRDAILKLLKSSEKQKKRIEKRKKEKRAKSLFYKA